jgi:predicted AlkP superfamily pyrophosphatase or phosphodiesterase
VTRLYLAVAIGLGCLIGSPEGHRSTARPIESVGAETIAGSPLEQPSARPAPRLLVILVVDQMRFDYFDRYSAGWAAGLKRLATEGAVFDRAFYPYLNTVTCAGHATIATGALPYAHGIIMNEWYQRGERRRTTCTEDPTVTSLPYTPPVEPIGHSAWRLRAPTLGDRLRAASPNSRVVTLSMKPRSTVMLAGHGGTAVTWFADSNVWATSTAFAPALVPEVAAFVAANPVEGYRSDIWERVRDAGDYAGSDQSAYERARPGWVSAFPHPMAGAPGTAPARFFDLWERSPLSDTYLGRLAAHLVREFRLGQRDAVDYLGVSFSSLDYAGHDFGPDSHEVQDTLFRLDHSLGELFAVLDEIVGRDRYAIGLSADHGVARIPEAVRAEGGDAGRVVNQEVMKVAEAAMTAAHGKGPHVALVEYTNVYLTEQARTRTASDPGFVQPLIAAVSKMDGVLRVFSSRGLESKRTSTDHIERAAALSYHPEVSGEVMVVLKPHWIGTNTSTATHGSAQPYDQHVPVVFLGAAFRPGRYSAPASPADLAPTLASLVRLQMPGVDGRVLNDALHK